MVFIIKQKAMFFQMQRKEKQKKWNVFSVTGEVFCSGIKGIAFTDNDELVALLFIKTSLFSVEFDSCLISY